MSAQGRFARSNPSEYRETVEPPTVCTGLSIVDQEHRRIAGDPLVVLVRVPEQGAPDVRGKLAGLLLPGGDGAFGQTFIGVSCVNPSGSLSDEWGTHIHHSTVQTKPSK